MLNGIGMLLVSVSTIMLIPSYESAEKECIGIILIVLQAEAQINNGLTYSRKTILSTFYCRQTVP